MMASRILSRFLPNTESGTLGNHYNAPEADDEDIHELNALLAEDEQQQSAAGVGHHVSGWDRSAHMPQSDLEDDVPGSLLMEGGAAPPRQHSTRPHPKEQTRASRAEEQWKRVQDRQPLHVDNANVAQGSSRNNDRGPKRHAIDAKEQAMWLWTNVQNLDAFLLELYDYYASHGIWSILLSRAIEQATTAFLFGLYLFTTSCIDYSKIHILKPPYEDVTLFVPKCMQRTSFAQSVLLWVFTFYWLWTLFKRVMDVRRLWSLHEFYHHLLDIPDTDLQTVSWERVVEGLMKLRNANVQTTDRLPRYVKDVDKYQSKQRMDVHDIANRLMRKDNYFVALFNKEIFDLSLPWAFSANRQFYSKSLEWCIQFCFQDFIFDDQGQVKPSCLKRQDRQQLIATLRRRLRFTAAISILLAPINIGIHCIYYLSRYYAEFRHSPGKLGARTFTPLAEWKFREFNELPHNFRLRTRMACPPADEYLKQFPRDKTHQVMQFVCLITGALAGLLALATALHPEFFLVFEITPGHTAFFYIPILMAVFAAARGSVPDESEVHEPVAHLLNVIDVTHYCPARWNHQLHSNDVRVEFSSLYQMRILIFLEEIMSLIIAPFILWRNSGARSEMIIDFFRNSTVQVDGLGYLCTFSVFDFRKSKNVEDDAMKDVEGLREEYFGTKDDKLALSQIHFMERVGTYDKTYGASRLRRPHYGMHLPPSFPPMSPLRQAAGMSHLRGNRAGNNLVHQNTATSRALSPQHSVLLDLNQAKSSVPPRRTRKVGTSARGAAQRRNAGDALSPDEGDEDQAANLDAVAMSRLIEEDSTLGDSWTHNPGVSSTSQASESQGQKEARPSNGVIGLLVEYSRAHAGGKGPRMG